jgi:heat shock protein HslJ
VALEAYHWDLTSATDQRGQAIAALQPVAGKPLRFDFAKDRIGISGGCNRIGGTYEYSGTALRLHQLAQTEMACADHRLMDADAAIASRLQGELQANLEAGAPPRLQLLATNGDRLVFAGTPTPQTRHGSEGTTVFLEVAPQRVPCPHPLIRDMQCLQVRERAYAGDGTLSSQGEWQPLDQEIEGYTHTPGTRNVLRLKRFTVKNPPADASSVAYVLDTVVESKIAGAAK